MKLLGGHYPLKPAVSSLLIKTALEHGAYIAWHAGTSEHGSNIEGMREAVELSQGNFLHLAHINAYCRGAIRPEVEETKEAIDLLLANPHIHCESYISPMNTFDVCRRWSSAIQGDGELLAQIRFFDRS